MSYRDNDDNNVSYTLTWALNKLGANGYTAELRQLWP